MKRSKSFPEKNLSFFYEPGVITCHVTAQHPGRVYFQATYWPARLFQEINITELQPGEQVEVIAREGLTLLVKPLPQRRE